MKIVIKVGTSTLAHPTGRINIRRIEQLVKVISDVKNSGHEIILVSSGAIGMGAGKLSLKERPQDMPTKQAASAVGQCELMYAYDKLFTEYNHIVAQILLTATDIQDKTRKYNFETTLERLLSLNAIPVVNENDTVATEEISLGDNDTLSAVVANCAKADLLVILTDIDGLYTADPRKDKDAVLIPVVEEITEEIVSLASGRGSSLGTGGMATKLKAAKEVTRNGIDMIVANGSDPSVLYGILEGNYKGTLFKARKG